MTNHMKMKQPFWRVTFLVIHSVGQYVARCWLNQRRWRETAAGELQTRGCRSDENVRETCGCRSDENVRETRGCRSDENVREDGLTGCWWCFVVTYWAVMCWADWAGWTNKHDITDRQAASCWLLRPICASVKQQKRLTVAGLIASNCGILTLKSLEGTVCTAGLNGQQFHALPHTAVFMCSVWISEQTAIISLYSINWLVCVTDRVFSARYGLGIYVGVCVCVLFQSNLRRRCVSNPLHSNTHPEGISAARSYPRTMSVRDNVVWCLLL
jgi:hypothetical protein